MVGYKSNNTNDESQTQSLMEFKVADGNYGINVAKVDEIMKYSEYPVTPMPNANPFVEGIFRPRLETMTVINLASYMGLPPSENEETDILIVTNFSNVKTAFHVHGVEAIQQVPLENISKPDKTIYGEQESMATGVVHFSETKINADGEEETRTRLITIIDFEKILTDISPNTGIMASDIDRLGERDNTTKPILIAEDSPLLERLILESLERAGFMNIVCTSNGKEAWDILESYKQTGEPIEKHVAAIVSDIEMPIMDGHRLLRLIKEDNILKKVPVILFSSLITDDMRELGVRLGASGQISKPEIAKLVTLIDEFIL